MQIRAYRDADAEGWLRCRVVAFLDCSYYNDVKTQRERYPHPSVCLVAEEAGRIVGLVDVELNSDDLSRTDEGRGAVLWHLAVLPEYRRQGVATALWECALGQLVQEGVRVCELWTQEDAAANRFYQSVGFRCEETSTWLRCYAHGKQCRRFLNAPALGRIYGPEELVFDAPVERRAELEPLCSRIDEVRLYRRKL